MQIEYNKPNLVFLENIKRNPAVLDVFKKYAKAKEIAMLLISDAGDVQRQHRFVAQVLILDNTLNRTELELDYDTALRIARMATNYQKAQTTKRIYPNLKYTLSHAAHPSKEHEKLYGIVRPIDDPFWDIYLPPNSRKCECGFSPTDEDITPIPDNLPLPSEGFRFNAGKIL